MKMTMRNMRLSAMRLAMLAMAAGLGGCGGGGEDKTALVKQIPVNTPASIVQESDADYNLNVNGLITAATLKRWKDDWLNERPAGITGKLVILQVSNGCPHADCKSVSTLTAPDETPVYIKPNGINVFTYLSPSDDWIQTRSNGVIETPSMVPDGTAMDALLRKFNIDPQRDMIVAAMGQGSTGNAMAQGRIWYALRYWGVDKKNLAILNGGNQWINGNGMVAGDFQATASSAPHNGHASVRDLMVDNTQLQATVQDMLAILPGSDVNVKNDGVFIWDARSIAQYSAVRSRTAVRVRGTRMVRCSLSSRTCWLLLKVFATRTRAICKPISTAMSAGRASSRGERTPMSAWATPISRAIRSIPTAKRPPAP